MCDFKYKYTSIYIYIYSYGNNPMHLGTLKWWRQPGYRKGDINYFDCGMADLSISETAELLGLLHTTICRDYK